MIKKAPPLLIEIGLGLILTGTLAWAYQTRPNFTETINLKTYDLFSNLRHKNGKLKFNTNDLRIVAIDEKSTTNLGRWPWPRALQAQLLDEVVAKGAKIIGLNILYSESDQNQGMEELSQLHQTYNELLNKQRPILKKKNIKTDPFDNYVSDLETAMENMNGDGILARSIEEAGNVVLPMYFQPGDALGNNLEKLPDYFDKEKIVLKQTDSTLDNIPPVNAAELPIEAFGKAALAIGHCNLTADIDGNVRRTPPLTRYGKFYYPSFGLQVVRESLNLQRESFNFTPGTGYVLENANIPIDQEGKTYIEFPGPAGSFQSYSAVDVLSDAVPDDVFSKKIVLIGLTTTGGADTYNGPGGERYTGLEIWCSHLENILNQRFITRPPWSKKAEWGLLALTGLVVLLVLPLMRARFSIPLAAVFFFVLLGGTAYIFIQKGLWISPAYSLTLLVAGFAVLVGKRLVFTEKGKELVEAESTETNKMLGLSFQGQGMLDLAFEKFRKCEVDDSMKELLYNLGLDMERKRQFTKAAAVFEHIGTKDPKYKDIKDKIELLKKAGEGAVFGGLGKKGVDATVVVDGLGQHTTLGRYEVVKELGRGAMGIVYLGRDPKINRQVAIKTLRFEEEMDQEQTKSIKERFFREAESAGNLTHPNIVRIFDAGEDQDVAYIAMELLDGEDLKKFCEKANLFPIPRVIEIIAQIADSLDYAHKQGVVHRDIKPGNIMLLKDGSLRITDFGIARIQATSKTATGAVLGTPAYMSPEQVAGKKADGRSDIFSLGVTFFELLTGEKPFHAESIAALLYQIANLEHANPKEFNPAIPNSVIEILDKSLEKDPLLRYQTAGTMANDLRKALEELAHPEEAKRALGNIEEEKAPAPAPVVVQNQIPHDVSKETKAEEPPANQKNLLLSDSPEADQFFSDLEKTIKAESGETLPLPPSVNKTAAPIPVAPEIGNVLPPPPSTNKTAPHIPIEIENREIPLSTPSTEKKAVSPPVETETKEIPPPIPSTDKTAVTPPVAPEIGNVLPLPPLTDKKTTPPLVDAEKTQIDQQEKTIVLEPPKKIASPDAPTLPHIEFGFQPPAVPKDLTTGENTQLGEK